MHNDPPMHPSDFPGTSEPPALRARGGAARRPYARRALALALGMALATASLPLAAGAADLGPAAPTPAPAGGSPAAVLRYDAARDAAADIDRALGAAAASGRRVLLIVGGDWCKDCRELDALLAREPALAQARDARFVPVKVYVGSDNRNEAVLARYPKLNWVPTLIELDARGVATRSTPSTEFRGADQLDPARVRAFFAGS